MAVGAGELEGDMASWRELRRCPIPLPRAVLAAAIGVGSLAPARGATGSGLGTTWLAETALSDVLQSQSVLLTPAGGRPFPALLQFELGFSTPETPAVGLFYDSLTLSLARDDGSGSTILATADTFGLTLAPGGVGGLIPGGSIRVSEVGFRETTRPGATTTFAYSVLVELPVGAQSAGYRATFDLFSNGDLQVSRGYAVAAPEPSVPALLAVGALGLGWLLFGRMRA